MTMFRAKGHLRGFRGTGRPFTSSPTRPNGDFALTQRNDRDTFLLPAPDLLPPDSLAEGVVGL